jgi:hypothetical protein
VRKSWLLWTAAQRKAVSCAALALGWCHSYLFVCVVVLFSCALAVLFEGSEFLGKNRELFLLASAVCRGMERDRESGMGIGIGNEFAI